jgi:biopolymer transport protein TolR
MAEINVVPYIDVMLVLLVIFMITAPLITAGVKVDLPRAEGEPLSADAEMPLIASVDAQGQYFLSVGEHQDEPLQLNDLVALILAHKAVYPEAEVYVNGDAQVSYGQVVRLFVALQKAGISKTQLMVEPEADQ